MKLIKLIMPLILLSANMLEAMTTYKINEVISLIKNPFPYNLNLQLFPGGKQDEDLLIAMHGMGSDYTLGEILKTNPELPYHIVSFNFPDYRLINRNASKTTFGTFNEIEPALFVLKSFIVNAGIEKVHLYGFSAGGGVIINALSILNSNNFDQNLQKMGIGQKEKNQILQAIQKGTIILEVPLKSFDEIAELFPSSETKTLAQRARLNGLNPIDNLSLLKGLSLKIFVYFANPDEALGNRDDLKFIQRLKNANNNGQTFSIIGKSGGHTAYHAELWLSYGDSLKNLKQQDQDPGSN